jgi:hypothetical protein
LHLDPEEAPVGRFGVNLDPVESDLRQISEADLTELSTVALQSVLNADESQGAFGRLTTRLPDLWVLVVFLILITGAVELYLAQRFSRSR